MNAPSPGFVPTDGNSSTHSFTASAPPITEAAPANPPYPNFGYPSPPPSYQNAMSYPVAAPPYPPNSIPNSYTASPAYIHPHITIPTLPQPPAQPTSQAVVIQVTQGPVCAHCGGATRRESDICCIICLIFLILIFFPFGLLFLCCFPCAVTMRCERCNRSA